MITIKLASGELANLEPKTAELVWPGAEKGTSFVRVGTVDIEVIEDAGSLVKRINADGGKVKKGKVVRPASQEGNPEEETENPPEEDEIEGGLST